MKSLNQHISEKLKIDGSTMSDTPSIEDMWLDIWYTSKVQSPGIYTAFTIKKLPESDLYGSLIKVKANSTEGSFVLYMKKDKENTTIHLRDPHKFVELFGEDTLEIIYNYCKELKR